MSTPTTAQPLPHPSPEAADLLMVDLLTDPDHGVVRYTVPGSVARAAVEGVAGLHRQRRAGHDVGEDAWFSARSAAWAAYQEPGNEQARHAARVAACQDVVAAAEWARDCGLADEGWLMRRWSS